MNPSRKKFVPKSNIKTQKESLNSETTDTFKKLDDLRTKVRMEHEKIVIHSSSANLRLGAAALIIIVGMSGIFIISQTGIIDNNKTPNSYKKLVDGFQQDTSAVISKTGNKITFIYIGAEYCPYCAILRWAVVLALSQYGTFSNLGSIYSDESNIPTYSFIGSSYSSNYIDFQPCEVSGNTINPQTNQYESLQQMDGLQNSLFTKYGTGYIPFVCIAGSIFRTGAGNYLKADSFSGQTLSVVQSQVTSKSGSLYTQIKAESDALASLIDQILSSSTTTTQPTNYKLASEYGVFACLKENLALSIKLQEKFDLNYIHY